MTVANPNKKILNKKDFLTLSGISEKQLIELLDLAEEIKQKTSYKPLSGKTLAMIFEKSSTRTRVSFEVGMLQLGGHGLFLSGKELQLGRGETIGDTAKVLSQYVDGIMIRTFGHEKVEELARFADVPVINGLTDAYHPCQALADLLTIRELKGHLKGLKMAYIGDGNNVAHSLMHACAIVGMDLSIGCPVGYGPNAEVIEETKKMVKQSGSEVVICHNAKEAVLNADIIYGDVWTSMGQEQENQIRLIDFEGFQINKELLESANKDYLFMHCLPAHRGEEVVADIIDGSHSVVFQQAGNRLHAQKALLVDLLG
ncbi:MAG: ornithine carbamoyltransferase [Bacillus sp. (in: firmicutes)]